MPDLNELLQYVVDHKASDLHIKVGAAPHVRIDGHLVPTPFGVLSPADTEEIARCTLPVDRASEFARTSEADFALSAQGVGRFRVNVSRQRGSIGLVLRRVMPGAPSFESLGLPAVVRNLAEEPRGLVLVTGPTGSGKTTTVASMIDHVNTSKTVNIVTIEDPIEFLHGDKKGLVSQREIGSDTNDYLSALKRVLRQDPDVIFIGEMRDSETVSAALSAAQTGHLVLSTLHTSTSSETINRIVDFFPPFQQRQIRMSLAASLRGVISQRLMPRRDLRGRIPAVEVLVMTGRILEAIVDEQSPEVLETLIGEGDYYGMQTFDQSLLKLCKDELVDVPEALAVATRSHDLRVALQNEGLMEWRPAYSTTNV